jgi:hypothetical protein
MSEQGEALLAKINRPAGGALTLRTYTEFVCLVLRERFSLDEYRELMEHFHCGADELVDKIVETKMVGLSRKVR